MKILKKILLVLFGLVAILLILALFIKKEYKIERQVSINKANSNVFSYVRLLKNQDHYNKWVMADPGMEKKFTGNDGVAGFIYSWNSNDNHVGKGAQEIKQIIENKAVKCEIRFEKPMESTCKIHMGTDSVGENITKVTWAMQGKTPYPMNLMNLFMDNMLGKDMEESLGRLKANLEN